MLIVRFLAVGEVVYTVEVRSRLGLKRSVNFHCFCRYFFASEPKILIFLKKFVKKSKFVEFVHDFGVFFLCFWRKMLVYQVFGKAPNGLRMYRSGIKG